MNQQHNPFANNFDLEKYNLIKKHRAFRSDKKFSEGSEQNDRRSHRNHLKQFIQAVPQDEELIQEYIQELKSKLNNIKSSSLKKKQTNSIGTAFKQRSACSIIQKSKHKSQRESKQLQQQKYNRENINQRNANSNKIIRYEDVRNEIKRSKHSDSKEITQKKNQRYAKIEQIYENNCIQMLGRRQKNSLDYRYRSNTQEVGSRKSGARMLRYNSLQKPKLMNPVTPLKQSSNINNSVIIDKVINVHHNINIYNKLSPNKHQIKKVFQTNQTRDLQLIKIKLQQQKALAKDQRQQRIEDISTIQAKKETIQFLGDSCANIKQQLGTNQKQVQRFLNFLGWKSQQLKNAFSKTNNKKRKYEDKLSKIFPKGFFQ